MAIAVKAVVQRKGDQVIGTLLGNYERYADALASVGKWIDEKKDHDAVCVVLNGDDEETWTLIPNL